MEWIIIKHKEPPEIINFMNSVFEIIEIRRKSGEEKGISFIVHSNEQNHIIPHVHAKYGKYEISIAIETGEVLCGNLPKKNQKIAVEWVLNHKTTLLSDWSNYVMSAISHTTKSIVGVNSL